ncbi:MAG: hypothetical protein K2K00_05830 [Muribaculaceae bacterium]|nr:hypothetical protein [Muribaculaceae bacterium]
MPYYWVSITREVDESKAPDLLHVTMFSESIEKKDETQIGLDALNMLKQDGVKLTVNDVEEISKEQYLNILEKQIKDYLAQE